MELLSYSAIELSHMLENKIISSVELTTAFLENIAKTDSSIGAFLTVCAENAIENARLSDKRTASGSRLHPLDGIPFALKDNICTKGIRTTCGSKMLEDFVPPYSATAAVLVEKCGAVLLGKLNMDEFGMGSTTEHSAFKVTRNPLNESYVPGGSSGGCSASVAAHQAVFALGSDTGGSVRQPAAFCGVTGLKPTYGRISRYGLVAFASSFDQIGVISQSVRDNAIVFDAVSGKDPLDATSIDNSKFNFSDEIFSDNLDGIRIAVPMELFNDNIHYDVRNSILNSIETFKTLGAKVEFISIPEISHALAAYYIICSAEASSNLARFDGVRFGHRSELFNGIDELYENSRSEGFGSEVKRRILLGTYVLSEGFRDKFYSKAQLARQAIINAFLKAFSNYDVILTPTTPTAAYKLGEKLTNPVEMYKGDVCTVCANLTGFPALSVPCGKNSSGLPIGLQLMGKAMDEQTLYRVGECFERAVTK